MGSRHSCEWRLSLRVIGEDIVAFGKRSVPPTVLGLSGMGKSAIGIKRKQSQEFLKNL
jgi:hypothetical protein